MVPKMQHPQPVPQSDLDRAAQEAAKTGRQQRVPVRGGYFAVSFLATEPRKTRPRRPQGLTRSSALWKVVGAVDDPTDPTDVSVNKHKYLAEA